MTTHRHLWNATAERDARPDTLPRATQRFTAVFRVRYDNGTARFCRSLRDCTVKSARERLLRRARLEWPGCGVVLVSLESVRLRKDGCQ